MSIAGKKTVFVASGSVFHANREIKELLTILDEYTGVKAKVGEGLTVETEKVQVRFFASPERIKTMDGYRCDVPVRFGQVSVLIAKNRDYPDLKSMKDIAKYIVEVEGQTMDNIKRYKEIIKEQQEKIDSLEEKIKRLQQNHEDRKEEIEQSAAVNWKQQICDMIDEGINEMLQQVPPQSQEENTHVEILREAIKWQFISQPRTDAEVEFLKTHLEDYRHAIKVCTSGSNRDLQNELLKLQKEQNEFILARKE